MNLKTLGGGGIDGYFGLNPDWSTINVKTGRTIWSSYDDNTLQAWIVEDTNSGGVELAGGNYANPIQIAGNGLPRIAGYFIDGFDFENPNQVGIDASGNSWQYIGASPLPYTVAEGTVPSAPDYEKVFERTASNVNISSGGSVQDFIDSFALKIFQSPTDGGLTEIQTRTVNANEAYEVRKTSDDSLATIYSDAAGTTEIAQNGTDNKSGSDGVVEFYIADGDYYVEVGGVLAGFTVESIRNFNSVEDMVANAKSLYGKSVETAGYYEAGDGGGAKYLIKTQEQATTGGDVLDGYGNHQLNNGLVAILQIRNDTIFVAQYGAIGDDVADDTNAINAATERLNKTAFGAKLFFDAKRYRYTGVWKPLTNGNEKQIIGAGSSSVGTQITFSYVTGENYCIVFEKAFSGLLLKGFNFRGQGIGVNNQNGAPQNGMTDKDTVSTSYGVNIVDIQFSGFSGDGADVSRWFQQRWASCYARDIGGYGYIIAGDQSTSWNQTGGAWFNNVKEYCLWFKRGAPKVENVNIGPCDNGIKIGDGLTSPCFASLYNCNFEWINEGGTGVLVTANSQIVDASQLLFYGPWVSGSATPNMKEAYAYIVFDRLKGRNVIRQLGQSFIPSNNDFGGWENRIVIKSTSGGSDDVLELAESRDNEFSFRSGPVRLVEGAARGAAVGIQSDKFMDRQIEVKGLKNSGIVDVSPIFWTRSVDGAVLNFNLFASGVLPTNSIYIINPDDGDITIDLPPPSNWIGKPLTITSKSNGTYKFILNTYGGSMVNGVDNPQYTTPYKSVTIIAVDSDNWIEI